MTAREQIFSAFSKMSRISAAASLGLVLGLGACAPSKSPTSLTAPRNHLLGEDRSATGGDDQLAGGVNAYLWRGAIDTLSFMPFATADAVGGIILTDWYSPPTVANERFKVTAYILDKRLRSDALRVSVFRQDKQGDEWVDTPVSANTTSDIAARIMTRARQLRADNGHSDD